MPGVRSPLTGITRCSGAPPFVDGKLRGARIRGVLPGSRVSAALHSKNDGLPVGQNLVQIHLKVGDGIGGAFKVDPRVVKKVGGSGIFPDSDVIQLPARFYIGGVELASSPALRGR